MDDVTFLDSVSLFNGLPEEDLVRIRRLFRREQHEGGAVILRQGDPGTDLYLVREGKVAVTVVKDGADCELAQLGEGAIFGEMSLFDSYPRSANVVALTPVTTFRLARADFTHFAIRQPNVLFQMCKVFTHRLRDTNSLLTQR